MNTQEYVAAMAQRGACTCGRCCDAPKNPEEEQPAGHTIDLTFFKVAAHPDARKEVLKELTREEFPQYFDGKEHNYLEIGADLGDQGLALMFIGLGHLLGCWKALCPETIMPSLSQEMKTQMAGAGMVSLMIDEKGDSDGKLPQEAGGD